jgi:hypothetical protein
MKNKPHPRWIQPANNTRDELENWRSRSHAGNRDGDSWQSETAPSPSSSPRRTVASVSNLRGSPSTTHSSQFPPTAQPSGDIPPQFQSSDHVDAHYTPSPPECFNNPSPLSAPSSTVMTPTNDAQPPAVDVIGDPHDVSRNFDLESILMTYPGMPRYDQDIQDFLEGLPPPYHPNEKSKESFPTKQHLHPATEAHCGCLHETSSYTAVLELSLRLRKASEILSRSANHGVLGSSCFLNRRIGDLDAIVTYVEFCIVHRAVSNIWCMTVRLLVISPRPWTTFFQ